MPSYKLSYFPIKALGEPVRFMFAYTGQEYEDNRIQRVDWLNIKPSMPFGKMPVLEIDGKMIHQSIAICRYLGKQAGIAGSNDWEALQIDMAVDTINDIRTVLAAYHYESDEGQKAKKRGPILDEALPAYLKKFDQLVKDNGGYIANGKLSWGDLYFVGLSDYLCVMAGSDVIASYPNLDQLRKKVQSFPKIAAWLNKRPKTDM